MLEFRYKKGGCMLVSAISANLYQAYRSAYSPSAVINNRGSETPTETAFNSLASYPEITKKENETAKIFDSINEWKIFCHKQIANGKLDIIA